MTTTLSAPPGRPRRAKNEEIAADDRARALDMGVLGTLIGFHLRCAQAAMSQHFHAALADHDVSPPQLGALFLVEANPGISQTAVAQVLRLDRSTVVQIVDRLEARDLVRRGAAQRDRRSHALRLTDSGAALAALLKERVRGHEAEFSQALSAEERASLMSLLARLHSPLDGA